VFSSVLWEGFVRGFSREDGSVGNEDRTGRSSNGASSSSCGAEDTTVGLLLAVADAARVGFRWERGNQSATEEGGASGEESGDAQSECKMHSYCSSVCAEKAGWLVK